VVNLKETTTGGTINLFPFNFLDMFEWPSTPDNYQRQVRDFSTILNEKKK